MNTKNFTKREKEIFAQGFKVGAIKTLDDLAYKANRGMTNVGSYSSVKIIKYLKKLKVL